jgi:hypothetical protein
MRIQQYYLCFFTMAAFSAALPSCAALEAAARSGGSGNSGALQKPVAVAVRSFGGADERLPPILTRSSQAQFGAPAAPSGTEELGVGASFITIELDVRSIVQPALVATLRHCDAEWQEDDNPIINDPSIRIGQSAVFQANTFSRHYTHRVRFLVSAAEGAGSSQLRFSGNWKAMIYDMDDMREPLAEARFFVVDREAQTALDIVLDGYSPRVAGTSPAALLMEASLTAPPDFIDNNFHTVTLYRAWRWNEPIAIRQNLSQSRTETLYNRQSRSTVLGFSNAQKRFRIVGVPAENEYRVLEIRDPMSFPASSTPLRYGLADLRRNGIAFMPADDGAMIASGVAASVDEYVPIEFALEPEGALSSRDIFIVGSFNNWQVRPDWRMEYDAARGQYALTRWVRRARHNYMYASGVLNKETGVVEAYDYEECEGNSPSANHTFYAFFYYRFPQFGGYDGIVGVAARNTRRKNR